MRGNRRNQRDRVRLSDVAERAGVSPITVSRALRSPDKVSEELRQTILQLVEEMGYTPDLAARALAARHSGVVGVLTPMINPQVFLNIMAGIEDRIRLTDLFLQYANTAYQSNDEVRQMRAFLAYNPAGIILASAERYAELIPIIEHASCPIVHIIDMSQEPEKLAVGASSRDAAAAAIRYMQSRGYRRIGIVGGSRELRSRLRLEGYRDAMREAGLLDEARVLHSGTSNSMVRGGSLLSELLERVPDLDSVFCHSDDVALEVLFECQRRGIRVPEDFGICGYHDFDFAASVHPGLTTVRLPRHAVGYRAADMLVRAIEGREPTDGKIDLGFTIVARGTTR